MRMHVHMLLHLEHLVLIMLLPLFLTPSPPVALQLMRIRRSSRAFRGHREKVSDARLGGRQLGYFNFNSKLAVIVLARDLMNRDIMDDKSVVGSQHGVLGIRILQNLLACRLAMCDRIQVLTSVGQQAALRAHL